MINCLFVFVVCVCVCVCVCVRVCACVCVCVYITSYIAMEFVNGNALTHNRNIKSTCSRCVNLKQWLFGNMSTNYKHEYLVIEHVTWYGALHYQCNINYI